VPTQPADQYDVTLEMGSPFPSPLEAPEVSLRVNDGETVRFTLSRAIRPYTLRARAARGGPIVVELRAPTWSRSGEPADQGVRVDALYLTPAR
jgi:hypothetical protein